MAVEPVVDDLAATADQRPGQQTPAAAATGLLAEGLPEETAPHMKAHMGGNQVIGLSSWSIARGSGNSRAATD
jgi:hypothetical protein